MKKRFRKKRYSRRRTSLSASNWGPLVKLLLCVLGILLGAALLTLSVLVVLEVVFHVDTPLPPDGIIAKAAKLFTDDDVLVVTPTPYIPPDPTPTPHPMSEYNARESEKEVLLPTDLQYYWFGDPSFCGGKMIFTAGKIVGDNVRMCALMQYDPETGSVTELPVKPSNAHIIYPVMNDEWLVFLDGETKGGGEIVAYRTSALNAAPKVIKTVYTGQPVIRLDGHYISWIERTGTNRDKLFVCDLETEETTVIAMFTSSSYGTSAPYMHDGTIIWASDGTEETGGVSASTIKHIELSSSGIKDLAPGTYVHDPETNGRYFAWLDAHHSPNAKLWCAEANDTGKLEPKLVAEGVVDFVLDDRFIAYSVDEVIFVYMFDSGESFRITPESELAQLLGADDGYVMWMDVTTRERDVLRYARIP